DDINERISALLDNELDSKLAQPTLDSLQADDELRKKWDRYHLIGDAMRGEAVRLSAESIADRVRNQIDRDHLTIPHDQPIPIKSGVNFRSRWFRTAGGAMLAASVAAITVMAFPQLTGTPSDSGPQLVVENTPPQTQAPYLIQSSSRWKNLSEPKVESKLNRYLIDHNEYVAPGGIGVIPYTSFVSYDTDR
ncbi:MAG: sigma-E factor negative regulatory protein, partial [Sedimenticola sp.]|nr:sigma-E factor negative regulatory protein [Sedimenticola sp.]